MSMDIFSNKYSVTVYIPGVKMSENTIEKFLLELFDLLAAYIEPLKDGVHKNDVAEYIGNELLYDKDFLKFLYQKVYVADASCFKALAKKYSCSEASGEEIPVLYKKDFVLDEENGLVEVMEKIADHVKSESFRKAFSKEMFNNV